MTTTDELALLAAVCEHPADDTPRLVYADWLEETAGGVPCGRCKGKGRVWVADGPYGYDRSREPCDGCSGTGTVPNHHADRAEFIRDCCNTLARHTDCPVRLADLKSGRPVPLRCGGCDYCLVRRRAERFYARHQWLTGVPYAVCFEPTPLDGDIPTGPGLTLVVRRGFVAEVRCPLAADWLTHADRLVWRPGLTDECPRCEGDGKAHGADRACEWSSRPDYNICPVCRCEWCDGTGTERVADAAGDMDDATCRKCGGRKATGRVPRPCPATAHPITKVTLTTLPTAEVGEFNALRKWVRPLEWGGDTRDSFEAEWDWITFTFQGAEDRR